jgi:hypothetical protein
LAPVWDLAKQSQLWTIEEFRERHSGRSGVIVIYDRVRDAPIAHIPQCRFVTESSFEQKMLEMSGKNGRYWWFGRFDEAQSAVGARRCAHCG